MADGQAVGRALRGAPPHAGAPGGAVLPVLGLQQLGARGLRGAHVQVAQREVAELQVQADAYVEGEPLAAGVGHCVARPGGAHGGGAAQTTEVERGGRPYKPLPGGA